MPVRKPRPRDSHASRQALLDAGAALFAQNGYKGTTLDALADRSGLNKAMVAYYFKSKSGLYQAVLDQGIGAVLSNVEAAGIESLPFEGRLTAFARAIASGFSDAPFLPGMLVQDYLAGDQGQRPEAFASLARMFATTRSILERGQIEGKMRAVDPHMLHLSLVGSLVFFGLTKRFRDNLEREGRLPMSNPDLDEYATFLGDMLGAGLRPKA